MYTDFSLPESLAHKGVHYQVQPQAAKIITHSKQGAQAKNNGILVLQVVLCGYFSSRVEGQRTQTGVFRQNASVLCAIYGTTGCEHDAPCEVVGQPGDALFVDFRGDSRTQGAGAVANHRRQPYHGIGPRQLVREAFSVAHVAINEIYRFAVALLIDERVINPRAVFTRQQRIHNGASQISGATYNQDFHGQKPPIPCFRSEINCSPGVAEWASGRPQQW